MDRWEGRNLRDRFHGPGWGLLGPEDMSADALPPSTDARDGHLSVAAKYSQTGTEGAGALIDGVCAGVDFSDTKFLLWVACTDKVGEFLQAFVDKDQHH